MANSPSTVIWRRIPVGSKIRLQSDGSVENYELPVIIKLNKVKQTGLEVDDLNPGPAEIPITATKQRWDLAPVILVMATLNKPITLKAAVVDTSGNPVSVSDGAGNMVPAEAQWQSDTKSGSMVDNLAILVRS